MKRFIYYLISFICIFVACILLGKYDLYWYKWELWAIIFSFVFGTILAWEANNE